MVKIGQFRSKIYQGQKESNLASSTKMTKNFLKVEASTDLLELIGLQFGHRS